MKEKTIYMSAASRTYLLMLVFTFITFFAGESRMEDILLTLVVLCVALVKGHLLGDHFMGLARVRGIWRWVVLSWLLIPSMMIGTTFVLTAR